MSIQELRNKRNFNLRSALFTAAIARFSGIILQVISLPIAAVSLGQQGFSIYSMLNAILAWLTLSNLGINQATTLHVAREIIPEKKESIFIESLAVSIVTSFAIFIVFWILTTFTMLPHALFSQHTTNINELQKVLLFIGFFFVINQILSIFEAVQLAYQKQSQYNKAIAFGTFFSAISVYLIAENRASVLAIIMAVHVPVILSRIINAVIFWKFIQVKNCNFMQIKMEGIKKLIKDGVGFLTGSTINNFLCHPFSILAVGTWSSGLLAASFSAVLNAIILASSVYSFLITPFRGALPEAAKNGDGAWIWRMYRLALLSSLGYSLVPSVMLIFFGDDIFSLWYQESISPSKNILLYSGVYIICLSIEVTNYNFLTALGKVKQAARWMMAKSITSAMVVWMISSYSYSEMIFLALTVINIVLSMLPLSFMTWVLYKSHKSQSDAAEIK